jgi:chromosome segregation ATPase
VNELTKELLEAKEKIEVLYFNIDILEDECIKRGKKIKKLKNRIKELEDVSNSVPCEWDIDKMLKELKELKDEVEDLNIKLNNANRTVATQMEGFDKMCEVYEGQL